MPSQPVDLGSVTVRAPLTTLRVTLYNPANPRIERIVFDAMPVVSERSSAQYREIQPLHSPGEFAVYGGSQLRSFTISDAKLFARTPDEAVKKLDAENLIRGWSKPYFGKGNAANTSGLPPDVLILSAYGYKNIDRIPVTLVDYTIDWPNDTDYITVTGEEMQDGEGTSYITSTPIVSTISLSLREVRSMREMNSFDLGKYKRGELVDWY